MDWDKFGKKFLAAPIGKEIRYKPDELSDLQPIIALTETVFPRFIAVALVPSGDNLLVSVIWDKEQNLFQLRARLCDASGRKHVLPETLWTTLERIESFMRDWLAEVEADVVRDGGAVMTLEFGPEDTPEQIIQRIADSGVFNVVMFNPEEGKAKRIA